MWRLIKTLVVLFALGGIGLVGYAYLGPLVFPADFAPPVVDYNETVTLEAE